MARSPASFLLLPAVLAALAGCATRPPGGGGPAEAAPGSAPPRADAGWLLLGRTEGASLYIDPRSTLRVGSSAFIMVVAANNQPTVLPGGATVGSLKEHYEIDCAGRRYRRHDGTAHPDPAALGPVLGRVGQDQWRGIKPQTVIAAVSSAVCSDAAAPEARDALPGPGLPFPGGRARTFRT